MSRTGKAELLLIEDNKADVALMKESLDYLRLDLNISVMSNGNRVMDFLQKKGEFQNCSLPDLIILDLNLPGKNGIEVLQEIRSSDSLKKLKVIILSTSRNEEDTKDSIKLGADAVFAKPSDFFQFNTMMKLIYDKYIKPVRKN